MKELIGEAAAYEMLAEECTELAQAALKKARKLRGENPTSKVMAQIDDNLREEVTDVILCLRDLDLEADMNIMYEKINRFHDRWSKR